MVLQHVERNWGGNPQAVSFDLKEYVPNGDGMPVYPEVRHQVPSEVNQETDPWRHYRVAMDISAGQSRRPVIRLGERAILEDS